MVVTQTSIQIYIQIPQFKQLIPDEFKFSHFVCPFLWATASQNGCFNRKNGDESADGMASLLDKRLPSRLTLTLLTC